MNKEHIVIWFRKSETEAWDWWGFSDNEDEEIKNLKLLHDKNYQTAVSMAFLPT